ncbi:DUF5808 domain-containing protein [Rhodococcoides yunnanense]|jgi:hypothetical protein|uniref:DUF5808 domain-containing protein n=1 Tax=Rhodococcoides yunnanense TaxID=278209 RepID=UPI0009664016|nr:DUF5808 domain-containing protein [Rhodococcus yunnanensis]MCZ4275339.1 DUF5808 domain-containing protein [Rhodococcus yunnanensis]OLT37159.1 hypothetical protein BJF84_07385 [Rhodococcus sp. CUA-806]
MTKHYLRTVNQNLGDLSTSDRKHALEALAAQLEELADAGIDPVSALGDPVRYAAHLRDALTDDTSDGQTQWRVLGLPVETRGPVSAEVRSRTWDPTNPRLIVPRLFGIGWTLNLGALAVKLGLIRPDDASEDVLTRIPARNLRRAQLAPLVLAGATAAMLAANWRSLPLSVASGFDAAGRPRGQAPRWTLIGTVGLGVVPALWAAGKSATVEDRLVRAASATSLAVISASTVAATVIQARHSRGRWGLLIPAALPLAAAASLAVIVAPLRSGLREVWRTATTETATRVPAKEQP